MKVLNKVEFIEKFGADLKKPLDRPAVVDFKAQWCQPCKVLHPILESMEQKYRGIDFYEVDTDDQQELAGDLNVSGIPTLYYLKGEGMMDITVGLLTSKGLEEKFNTFLGA